MNTLPPIMNTKLIQLNNPLTLTPHDPIITAIILRMSKKEEKYLDDYSHLLAPPTESTSPTEKPQSTSIQNKSDKLTPDNKFRKPCFAKEGQVQDIEDIIFNGICRPRPDKIKWMCTFRRRLIPGETYRWCQCGKSGDIYCDDTCTEEPTRLGPFEFSVVDKVTNHALCGCRYTAHPPFCDGTHGVPFLDLEEWLDEHPEDRERVQWLLKNKQEEGEQGDGCQGNCQHGDAIKQGCNEDRQNECNGAGKCLDHQDEGGNTEVNDTKENE